MGRDYPSDWDSRRKKVYQRDDYTCQNCGTQGGKQGSANLHAHHVVPKSNGGSHKLDNLKTLCEQCHSAVHNDVTAPTGRTTSSSTSADQRGIFWWLFVAPFAAAMWLLGAMFKASLYFIGAMFWLMGAMFKLMLYLSGAMLWMFSAMIRVMFWPLRKLAS